MVPRPLDPRTLGSFKMSMEQAVFISKVEQLKYCDDNFTRLYFGIEFCERLLPTMQQLKKVLSVVKEREVGLQLCHALCNQQGVETA